MKKPLTLLVAVMICCSSQLLSQNQFYFGLAGTGLGSAITNQNNYGLNFELSYKVTIGGSFNAGIGYDFNDHFGLKTEIGFAKLGQRYQDTYNDTLYTRNLKLNYLQIPLLLKYRMAGGVAKFYVMAGLQFDLLLSASQRYLKDDAPFNEPVPGNWIKPVLIGEQSVTDRFNPLDLMARIDVGADIALTKDLFLNAGFTMAYGMTDINDGNWHIPEGRTGEYHASHNFYAGITVGISYILPVGTGKKNG